MTETTMSDPISRRPGPPPGTTTYRLRIGSLQATEVELGIGLVISHRSRPPGGRGTVPELREGDRRCRKR